jgi:intein/homing endonuclease
VINGVLHINPHPKQAQVFKSKKKIIAVLAGVQSGKCLKKGTSVTLSNGKQKKIESIVHGDTVLSIDDDLKIVDATVKHVINSGILPTYEVKTTSGRRITVSETHPFLTKDGWKEIKDIKTKDFVAVPRHIPAHGNRSSDEKWLRLIGYLLGDGGISQGSVNFTNIDPDVIEDFTNSLPNTCKLSKADDCTYRVVNKRNKSTMPVKEFLKKIGMMGHTAHTKSIPEFIFSLKNEHVAIVINRLFTCDGWVDTKGVGYASVSRRLMYDVHHLLLRFGIKSRIRYRYTTCNHKKFPSYGLTINRKEDVEKFQKHIGIFSKDKKLAEMLKTKEKEQPKDLIPYNTDQLYEDIPRLDRRGWVPDRFREKYELLRTSRTANVERNKLKQIAEMFDKDDLKHLASSDIFWDTIKEIEYKGEYPCYDLEIEDHHNFIADDFFVHNTVCGPIWMYQKMLEWDKKLQDGTVVTDAACLAVSPSFPLLDKKLLPTYQDFFIKTLKIGEYHVQKKRLDVTINRDDGSKHVHQIFFASAMNEESLASITANIVHIDEGGMDGFKLKSWREIEARIGSTDGYILITTTIYNWGWLRTQIYDKWLRGSNRIDVIRFESIDNPFYSRVLWNEAKASMPKWLFRMRHCGQYDKPAGMIYDAFDENKHVIDPFEIPLATNRWVGIDPGLVHHATCWAAEIQPYEPEYMNFPNADRTNSVFVIYRTSLTGSTTATKSNAEHAKEAIEQDDYSAVKGWFGGSKAEKYFRGDYLKEGIEVHPPQFSEVDSGINALYKLMKQNRFYVFSDQKMLLYPDETTGEDRSIQAYSHPLDEFGNPTDGIAEKEKYHLLDCLRYLFLGVETDIRPQYTTFVSMSGPSLLDV